MCLRGGSGIDSNQLLQCAAVDWDDEWNDMEWACRELCLFNYCKLNQYQCDELYCKPPDGLSLHWAGGGLHLCRNNFD